MPLQAVRFDWAALPEAVRRRSILLVRDLLAASVPGSALPAARISAAWARTTFAQGESTLLATGEKTSSAAAAFANGVLSDTLALNDGHVLAKGHPGANVIPAALAVAEEVDASATEFLAAVVYGYEVAVRAAMDLHRRMPLYRGAGAWGGISAAAALCRLTQASDEIFARAIGLAEYHAPYTPLLRSLARPAMTKDAIGWGAMEGVMSFELARSGFTALESEFLASGALDDLGERWLCLEGYVKPFPVIRLAQPALKAALMLRERHGLRPDDIRRVSIRTFVNAAGLPKLLPTNPDEAQYGLVWPVAYALAHGRYDVEATTEGLADDAAARLFPRITVAVHQEYEALYPARRFADVVIETVSGETYLSGPVEPDGEAGDPAWEAHVDAKFRRLVPGIEALSLDLPVRDVSLRGLSRERLIAAACHGRVAGEE